MSTSLIQLPGSVLVATWSADGGRIICSYEGPDGFTNGDTRIVQFSLADAPIRAREQFSLVYDSSYEPAIRMDLSPDGTQLAYSTVRSETYLLTGLSMGNDPLALDFESAMTQPVWSPDGTQLALGALNYERVATGINMVDLDTLSVAPLGGNIVNAVDWSPDGNWFIYATGGDEASDLYLMRSDGSAILQLTDSAEDEDWPVWQP